MFGLIRLVLVTIFLSSLLSAATKADYVKKYNQAKKNYISVISVNNKAKEIKYLKELIYYGTKINKSVYKYKRELKRLDKTIKLTNNTKHSKKTSTKYSSSKKKYNKYDIDSVYTDDNSIVINFNRKISKKDIKFFTRRGKNSFQHVFDISGRFKDAKPTKLSVDSLNRIKIVQYRFKTLRITLFNNKKFKTIYIVNRKQIIIKVIGAKKARKTKVINVVNHNDIRRKTIVIDAGHGGRDAGAVGPGRRYEKTVTLKTAKQLYYQLKKRGYRVYLTRNKDRKMSLRLRTKLANRKNADMFISIHANAAPKKRARKARGIETYFLSPARSARAKRVAALENKGDMNFMGWSSKSTFLTVLNQGKITASNKMAIDIQKNMLYSLRQKYGKKTIRDGGVREGPFWVLVGAQMPSVLIEVGYISHPSESKRIYTSSYQRLMGEAIANGIDSYFLKNQ